VARQTRLDAPGTLHHVMVWGIEGRRIVDDEQYRKEFVVRLGTVALVESYGMPLAEVARQVGVSTSAISKALTRAEK